MNNSFLMYMDLFCRFGSLHQGFKKCFSLYRFENKYYEELTIITD